MYSKVRLHLHERKNRQKHLMQAKWTDRGDTGTLQGKITKTTTKALLGGLQERNKWKDQTKMKK